MREDKEINEKSNFVWNAVAGIINASEAVILLAVITRTNGIYDAGILTIAFAVANLLSTVGKFGIRNYQVTDVDGRFGFETYLGARIVTVCLMMLASFCYILYGYIFKEYAWDKAGIIFFMCMVYAVEAFEDVFAGQYQRIGRLDMGGKIFTVRWALILSLFSMLLVFTHNLFYTSLISMLISILCCIVLLCITYRRVVVKKICISFIGTKKLLWYCSPLFGAAFLQFYLINAPKYAIDTYLTEEIQACYGFVAMPVFVIGLLNSFIYQPQLVRMAIQWREHDYYSLKRGIWKQIYIITAITIVCLIGAYAFGVPVLSWLYHTDLFNYKTELLVLMLGGGFLAVVGLFCVILTIIRRHKWILYCYAIVSLMAILTVGQVVKIYGSKGAAMAYTILIAILMFILGIAINRLYHRIIRGNMEEKVI